MVEIKFSNVKWEISDEFAIRVPELTLQPNVYKISGGNGSGKSLLLRYLSKSVKSPKLSIDNSSEKILYLTNEDITFPYLTIEENLKLNHLIFGIDKEVNKKLFSNQQLKTICEEGSLGMRQKVGLSLVFVRHHWDLIIIDETLSNLDDRSRRIMLDELCQRAKEGAIVLLVDHQLEDETFLKIIKIDRGKIYEG